MATTRALRKTDHEYGTGLRRKWEGTDPAKKGPLHDAPIGCLLPYTYQIKLTTKRRSVIYNFGH